MFSREFCEIFRNTFFTEHTWATNSGISMFKKTALTQMSVDVHILQNSAPRIQFNMKRIQQKVLMQPQMNGQKQTPGP